MKRGDLVRYGYSKYSDGTPVFGIVLSMNTEGGTLKVMTKLGQVDWFVTSYCEVVSEGR